MINITIHGSVLCIVVLGYETWSLVLRDIRSLTVYESVVLRMIFLLKKEEKTEDWRKFHSKELNDLDFSPDFIWLIKRRRMRWVRHVARVGEKGNIYSVWVTKTEDMTPP
jgi:hypothetical protein